MMTIVEMAMMHASAVKTPPPSLAALLPGEEPPEAAAVEPERCGRCPKRLCWRYKCGWGSTFCTAHRLPETHGCNYNFKAAGAAALAKANPVVVESKLERLRRKGSN